MNRRHALWPALIVTVLLHACAHAPRAPAVDRSPAVDLAGLAKRFGTPRCQASVPISQAEALALAEQRGAPHPEEREDWVELASAIRPGDQLRQVSCVASGPGGEAAGVIFFGVFRSGALVAEMHPMIIN